MGDYVATAKQGKMPVVLKIGNNKKLIEHEYFALKHFNGMGAIKVFDIHHDYAAFLLEAAIPGFSLKNKENNIEDYAEVVKQIASHPKPKFNFLHVTSWLNILGQIKDPRIERAWVEKAIQLKIYLLSTIKNEYLCHGDLHLENILKHKSTLLPHTIDQTILKDFYNKLHENAKKILDDF